MSKSRRNPGRPCRVITQVLMSNAFSSSNSEPVKPSKSALKKAAAAARKERRHQEKAAARTAKAAGSASPASPTTPQPAESPLSFPVVTSAPEPPKKSNTAGVESSNAKSTTTESVVNKTSASLAAPAVPKPSGLGPAENGHPSSHPVAEVQPPRNVKPATSANPALAPRAEEVTSPKSEAAASKVPSPPSVKVEPSKVATEIAAPLPAQEEEQKKRQNVLERTIWTFIMIGGFIGE